MKKLLLLIAFITTAISANAQFELTPNGLICADDPTKSYIVIDFEGKTAQELFERANVYFLSLYVSPKDVISTVDNAAITINGITKQAIAANKKRGKALDIKYTFSFAFKDGKMRVNIPYIIKMYHTLDSDVEFYVEGLGYPFYNGVWRQKTGKLQGAYAKQSIEDFFNTYVENLRTAIENPSDSTDNDW